MGHRTAKLNEREIEKLKKIIEDLIVNNNVTTFLFGSLSEFDYICHLVVTELKENYTQIKRIAYTCRSEACILESERHQWEEKYSRLQKREIKLLGVEEDFEHKTKYTSNRASYVERNYAMIDDSDYCIFYYDSTYLPDVRKYSKRSVVFYQPKSGTSLAFSYAKRKKKNIINIFES